MKILSGNSNKPLAEKISSFLGLPLVKTSLKIFSDKEIFVEILDELKGEDVFLIQAISFPVNDTLMELLITLNALKQSSPCSITVVIPYYGYARQDRLITNQSSVASELIAQLLQSTKIKRIITIDLHAPQIKKYFTIPLDNLSTAPLFCKDILTFHSLENLLIVSPDAGGQDRAQMLAHHLNVDVITLQKERNESSRTCTMKLNASVVDQNCIIVDDIVDTAETLCKASELLMEKGAKSVNAYCTHPLLSGSAFDKITLSPLQEVVFTDSIFTPMSEKQHPKFRHLSIAFLLAEAISSCA
ncbi:MAG: ribose-phosphate diphosphokinase [Candidatus Paracaedimonas acanthamoebae]|uniref:ribose-phosphate diphosphokinase n=1 Tax=Candidatus Paracaedimonas acanthamoebae TaxID=244581 RepID=A0A8J7TTE7_9PROT|nr:ribose-phosphate diphosphokinase [Candidatus Paracaedimonas acanthamoebae]